MLVSTRDKLEKEYKSSDAIIMGLAPDGGLFIKKELPRFSLDDLKEIKDLNYYDLATLIITKFLDDVSKEEISKLIKEAYINNFDIDDCVKLHKTKDAFVLELFHGPTCAFKDMALLVLPKLVKLSHEQNNDNKNTIILTATSGDTGSSALNGFKDDANTKMIVFYPTNGVSRIQERQMLSLASTKNRVIASDGNFDDCQNLVKKIFNENKKYNLSSANSINIGRLLPQIVYYFKAYFDLVNAGEIKLGDKINYSVPTGNFGDILGGYLALKIGLPINKLICASNDNNVLTDFFNTRIYNKNRILHKTISPSMDILISSNLERLLYYVTGNAEYVKELMDELKEKGSYKLDKKYDLSNFSGYYLNEEETKKIIRKVYEDNNYLIDTHTAVSFGSYLKYKEETADSTKTVVLSTAHPYKFPIAILSALGETEADEFKADEFEVIEKLVNKTEIKKPSMIEKLNKEYEKTVWSKEEAVKKTLELIEELSNV